MIAIRAYKRFGHYSSKHVISFPMTYPYNNIQYVGESVGMLARSSGTSWLERARR
jgi:hypothetical protein